LESDLDGSGELFGWKFSDEDVTIYMEDDGYWHPKMNFHVSWIRDFVCMATEIGKELE